jgi:hypothetical protein
MAPTDERFWSALMPIIGPLPPERRTQAVAYVLGAVRDRDVDDAMITRLTEDLRRRFGGEATCH